MEELKAKYEELYQAVYMMRHYQLRWYSFHIDADKKCMLYHQKKVDEILTKETKERKSLQQKIFK